MHGPAAAPKLVVEPLDGPEPPGVQGPRWREEAIDPPVRHRLRDDVEESEGGVPGRDPSDLVQRRDLVLEVLERERRHQVVDLPPGAGQCLGAGDRQPGLRHLAQGQGQHGW
jgi:hypothetical protein